MMYNILTPRPLSGTDVRRYIRIADAQQCRQAMFGGGEFLPLVDRAATAWGGLLEVEIVPEAIGTTMEEIIATAGKIGWQEMIRRIVEEATDG